MSGLRVVNTTPREDDKADPHTPPKHDERPVSPDVDADYSSPLGTEPTSNVASPAPLSIFDIAEEPPDEPTTEPTTGEELQQDSDERYSYNLKPPPPNITHNNLEAIAARFFSVDHLNEILHDSRLALRFTQFLAQYRSKYSDTLKQYAEVRKAATAIEFANAVAARIQARVPAGQPTFAAAVLDDRFDANMRRITEELVEEALPAYLTHRLVTMVTDTLVREITGNSAPILHDLIPSLAEVYCVTDVSMPDNPIVYASEEFYNTSQYSRDYVIGRNCRFLQGPGSSSSTVNRMIAALRKGEEICETLLNYRRDGSAFMNLLMIAPLYDNKGVVRYFLGCQIDVSSLIEDGRGMESFAQLLSKDRSTSNLADVNAAPDAKQMLADFGRLLTEDEVDILKDRTSSSFGSRANGSIRSTAHTRKTQSNARNNDRVILGMEDIYKATPLWPDANLGHSGRLPGVYQNYLLVRPYPSLRITFTSPAMRIPGLLQTKLLDRVAGPPPVRDALLDALSKGNGVTAKVAWLTSTSEVAESKTRWIHCTPLFGSDDRVGVWMVVMVADERVTGLLNPQGNGDAIGAGGSGRLWSPDRFTAGKMYAEYVRRDGRPVTADTHQTSSSTRERRETDEHFRGF